MSRHQRKTAPRVMDAASDTDPANDHSAKRDHSLCNREATTPTQAPQHSTLTASWRPESFGGPCAI